MPTYGAPTPRYNVPVYRKKKPPTYGPNPPQYHGYAGTAVGRRIERAGGLNAALSNIRRGIGAAKGGRENYASANVNRSQVILKMLRKRASNRGGFGPSPGKPYNPGRGPGR